MQVAFLGQVAYEPTYEAMQRFSTERDANTDDELWICAVSYTHLTLPTTSRV